MGNTHGRLNGAEVPAALLTADWTREAVMPGLDTVTLSRNHAAAILHEARAGVRLAVNLEQRSEPGSGTTHR